MVFRIRLQNFRCYRDSEFELQDVTLISAESGAGKSSILLGILYALYGTKTKSAKLVSYEASACIVTLTLNSGQNPMVITRSSSPSRLTLTIGDDQFYEGVEAQSIIHTHFGSCFSETSFVTQNPLNAFIVMKPTEKLEFLERFAFQSARIPEMKEKAREVCKTREEEAMKAEEAVKVAREILYAEKTRCYPTALQGDTVIEPPRFPFQCKPDMYEKYIKREKIRMKNADVLTRKAEKRLQTARSKLSRLGVYRAYKEGFESTMAKNQEKLTVLLLDIENTVAEDTEEELMRQLESVKKWKRVKEMRCQLQTEQARLEDLSDDLEKEAESITVQLSNLEIGESTLEDAEALREQLKEVEEYQSCIREIESVDVPDVEKLKRCLDDAEKELRENVKASLAYTCPCCDARLYLHNDTLEQVQREVVTSIKDLTDTVQKYKKQYEEGLKVRNRVEWLEKRKDTILSGYEENSGFEDLRTEDLRNEISAIEDGIEIRERLLARKDEIRRARMMAKKMRKGTEESILKLQAMLSSEGEVPDTVPYDEKEVEEQLRGVLASKAIQQNARDTIDALHHERRITEINWEQKRLEFVDIEGEDSTEEAIKVSIQEEEKEIEKQRENRAKAEKALEDIAKWERDTDKYIQYSTLENKVKKLNVDFEEATKRYLAAQKFRQDLNSAESIAAARVIDSINAHAKMYLDAFFEEDPISVQLSSFRENKKSIAKPQINVTVVYKGCEAELESLSGGELARVILAFTLALSEMVNSPLLLLDECTANLNQELTSRVFDVVKEHSSGKTVLVVAHQVVEGVFDNVLKLT